MKKVRKKYIVFIGSVPKDGSENINEHAKKNNYEVLSIKQGFYKKEDREMGIPLTLDFNSETNIQEFIHDFGSMILGITARGESNITYFKKIIPFLPSHLLTPSVAALTKSTEKTEMRKAFLKFDKKITPKFEILEKSSPEIIDKISKKIGFPVMVKPAGLAQAKLVQAAHYPEELSQIIAKISKKMTVLYKQMKGRGVPKILVEEIIEGDQFSVDAFINKNMEIFFTPFVRYTTSNQKGFDDFFSYEQITPALLSKESVHKARTIAEQGIKALDLRNSSAHIELIRDREGVWKIIEIGPRLGGFRSFMYKKSFGINLDAQDINIRIGKKIDVQKKKRAYTSVIKFFAKKEGIITSILGIEKAKKLESFDKIVQRLKKGDKAEFAKNGGDCVFRITLHHENKTQLVEDRRKLEKMIHIETRYRKIKK